MGDLEFGLRMTVLGMGIVFAMLLLLWGLLALAVRLDRPGEAVEGVGACGAVAAAAAVQPDAPSPPSAPAASPVEILGEAGLDPALVAAITIAVRRHAEARRLQAAPAMRSYWPGSLLFASRWVAAGRTRQGQSWRRRPR
jgi:glutaconyl-CoA/methylmalonyl-CoA decarboxylase subunit delta